MNDAVDAAADRINRPDRPIPSGRLSAGSAQAVSWICLALGALWAPPWSRFSVGSRSSGVAGSDLTLGGPWRPPGLPRRSRSPGSALRLASASS